MNIQKIETNIQKFTIEFYMKMINDEKKRGYYRIDYYLYFLQKANNQLFDDDYKQTKTSVLWPGNEDLMLELIRLNDQEQEQLIQDKYWSLNENEQKLVDLIYSKYCRSSDTHLKELVKENIKTIHIFDNLSLEEQVNITIKKFIEQYNVSPQQTMELISNIFRKHNIQEYKQEKPKQKKISPIKKVI